MTNHTFRALALPILLLTGCQHLTHPATGFGPWQPDSEFSNSLTKQDVGSNGIEVGEPKIYDDSSLRLMLDQARQRLAAINGLNEAALTSRLGAVTGSRIDQSQVGIQVTGPSLPGVATEANSASTKTTTMTSSSNPEPSVSTETNSPTQKVTTTTGAMNPPSAPAAPSGLAFTAPSGLSVSSLDALNEEMQLTNEIASLQLLLEGALSDRFVANLQTIKPRATIGFPISLAPQPRYKTAVAVVEIEVETAEMRLAEEPPSITVLLPREKTYNVAALTDRTTSIGGGAVIGTVGVAGSWVTGHKTFYLVQDQDTVALQRPTYPENENPKNK
ncbi:MAG: hypothetical protein ACJ76N_10510, partial [Thermoanaerobaculia bacterium]